MKESVLKVVITKATHTKNKVEKRLLISKFRRWRKNSSMQKKRRDWRCCETSSTIWNCQEVLRSRILSGFLTRCHLLSPASHGWLEKSPHEMYTKSKTRCLDIARYESLHMTDFVIVRVWEDANFVKSRWTPGCKQSTHSFHSSLFVSIE